MRITDANECASHRWRSMCVCDDAHGIRCVTPSVLSRGLKSFTVAFTLLYLARRRWHLAQCAARIFYIIQWCGVAAAVFFFVSFLLLFVAMCDVLCVRASNNIFSNTMDSLLLFRFGGANAGVYGWVWAWLSSVIHLGLWKSSWE